MDNPEAAVEEENRPDSQINSPLPDGRGDTDLDRDQDVFNEDGGEAGDDDGAAAEHEQHEQPVDTDAGEHHEELHEGDATGDHEATTEDESNVQIEQGETTEGAETTQEGGEHTGDGEQPTEESGEQLSGVELGAEESMHTDTVVESEEGGEQSPKDGATEASGLGGTTSPTSRHRELQRKKNRAPRRKLDDNMIAEEEGQEDGFKSPTQMPPLEAISQNLDDGNRYYGHEPEMLKPSTPDKMMMMEGEGEEIVEEPELKLTREEIVARYHAAIEERERNQNLNNQLHHKLADYFRKRKTDDAQGQQMFEKSSQDQESRYNKYIQNIEELHKEFEKQQDKFDYLKYEMKQKCEHKQEVVQEERGLFLKLKRDTSMKSVSGHTGKAVTSKDIEPYLQKEALKEQEVIQVRLENIKLKNQLKKRENQLKEKEELGEGLHLIDFEQLKIENQTYNEKIEERNEELMKLKKKINNTVQILTHVKEKLKFVNAENETEKDSLAYYDEDVKRRRDVLNRIKQSRDSLRLDNNRLKQNSGLLGNTILLRDFEESVDENESLRAQIEQYKRKHAELILNSKGLKKKISQVKANEK